MPAKTTLTLLLSTVALLGAPAANAQTPGASSETIERDARTGAPRPVPQAPVPPPIGDTSPGIAVGSAKACSSDHCIEVRALRFEGNVAFSGEELAKIAKAGNPKAMSYDLEGLRGAAAAVMRFYRHKGYMLATAWIPPQQAGDGTILIRVAEGKLSSPAPVVPAVGAGRKAADAAAVVRQKLCGAAACQDRPILRYELEGALLTASDTLGANVTAQLAPGVQEGSSILYVDAVKRMEPFLTIGADNYGSASVGKYQFAANLSLANSLTSGDRLSVQAMTTQKADVASGGVQYSLPVALTGMRVAVGGFYSNYTLTGEFAPLGAHGRSYGGTGALSWTLLRRTNGALTLSSSIEVARLSDVLLSLANGRDHWSWRIGAQGQFGDTLLGTPARTQLQLDFVRTSLDFDDPRFNAGDTEGVASKLVGRINRVQSLTHGFTLEAALSGQLASRNLDAYDKLTISGPSGVRAYPTGEYGGDRALVGQFSLGWATGLGKLGVLSLEGFYDAGWARLKIDPLVVSGNDVHLDGAGGQVSLAREGGYALSLFWARAISTPASQIDGHKDRLGVSLNYAF